MCSQQLQISVFRAIVDHDLKTLEDLAVKLYIQNHVATAALAFDHIFSSGPKFKIASAAEISDRLSLFAKYVDLLHQATLDEDPCNDPNIQHLLAIKRSTEDWFLIPHKTFIYPFCNDRLSPARRETDQGCLVGHWELKNIIVWAFKDRLRRRILEIDDACRSARAFRPCLPFVVIGRCPRDESCFREHVMDNQLHEASYNLRVRVHLQQILIYNFTRNVQASDELLKGQM